jgi:uncharacterized protein
MALSLFPRHPQLRTASAALLPEGSTPIRLLHISDLHLTSQNLREIKWIKSLVELKPDVVVSTGDHLAAEDAVPIAIDALGGLLDLPGFFVFGSNDYYAPKFKSPHRYLLPSRGTRNPTRELPWRDLLEGLTARGWIDLNNQKGLYLLNGLKIEWRGTDDAHLNRDQYSFVRGKPSSESDLAIGVTHAPYLRLLDEMVDDQIPLLLAGHTHGGQWRLPWPGGSRALVTNCDLPRKQARGLSSHRGAALHVSAGVGTSPYAPLRFACPPEATLLTLTPRRHSPE